MFSPRASALREARDPRDRVTPDDLNVAPALLGAPLARPGRRLLAIGIDVAIVAAVSDLGNLWLLAGAGLIVLVHLRARDGVDPRPRRLAAWALAAVLLAVGAQQAWVERGTPRVRERAEQFDEETLAALAPGAAASAALARIEVLEAQLAAARKPKTFDLRAQVATWADEVGLGLGWAIVYFTLLPVWWNGQTLGKKLLGLRAVELTGKPMTALRAFKRYGGYAAGMATGGFGFAQVLWDPNRQAIQDKTAHTVVIDLRRKIDPLPTTPPPEEPR